MGYLGLHLPEAVGGQGLGMIELAIVLEEMGRACAPGPYLDVVLAATLLDEAGGRQRLVSDVTAGRNDRRPSLATTRRMRVTPGRRRAMPMGACAAPSISCRSQPTPTLCSSPPRRASRSPRRPFATTPLQTLDPAQRFSRVEFDHAAELVAEPSILARLDPLMATAAAAMLLGVMSRAFEITLDYVKTRQAFGRPIGSFQALQHRLAEMLLRVESTRSAVYRAAWSIDNAEADAALAAASAKAYAGDASRLVCGESIQMHGGIGFTWELDLHFFFKRAKTLEGHYGSTEVQLERALSAAGL